jgi:hypothetical protein
VLSVVARKSNRLTRISIYLASWNAYAAWALPGSSVDKEVRKLGSMPL